MDELRRIRKERGLSQQRLSELANVDKVTIVHIENGKVSPKVETLEKLAAALEVELADLFPKMQAPLFLEPPDSATQEERRAQWATAVHDAHQLREHGRARMEVLLEAWHKGKEREYLRRMGELLDEASGVERALEACLADEKTGGVRLDLARIEDLEELQAASRFYGALQEMLRGARLRARKRPRSHIVEDDAA